MCVQKIIDYIIFLSGKSDRLLGGPKSFWAEKQEKRIRPLHKMVLEKGKPITKPLF